MLNTIYWSSSHHWTVSAVYGSPEAFAEQYVNVHPFLEACPFQSYDSNLPILLMLEMAIDQESPLQVASGSLPSSNRDIRLPEWLASHVGVGAQFFTKLVWALYDSRAWSLCYF